MASSVTIAYTLGHTASDAPLTQQGGLTGRDSRSAKADKGLSPAPMMVLVRLKTEAEMLAPCPFAALSPGAASGEASGNCCESLGSDGTLHH